MNAAAQIEGMLSEAECDLLTELGMEAQFCIVEIGSYRGRSTIALASKAHVPVYAIDPHEPFTAAGGYVFAGGEDRQQFMLNILDAGMAQRIRLVNLPSVQVAQSWRHPVDLLWIDGDHRAEAVRADVAAWQKYLVFGGMIAFHDINEPGVNMAMRDLVDTGNFDFVTSVNLIAVYRRRDA